MGCGAEIIFNTNQMSNYLSSAVNPKTNEYEEVAMLDDFYGRRNYAVLFKNGDIYPSDEVSMSKPSTWDDFDTKAAYSKKNKPVVVSLSIPGSQRLGQAIMNAYRDRWAEDSDGSKAFNLWEQDADQIQAKLDNYFLTPKDE